MEYRIEIPMADVNEHTLVPTIENAVIYAIFNEDNISREFFYSYDFRMVSDEHVYNALEEGADIHFFAYLYPEGVVYASVSGAIRPNFASGKYEIYFYYFRGFIVEEGMI